MKLEETLETIRKFNLALQQLKPKERTVFRLRIGKYIIYNDGRTLEEVRKMMGLKSRERVRQLEEKALAKVRAFLDDFKNTEPAEVDSRQKEKKK